MDFDIIGPVLFFLVCGMWLACPFLLWPAKRKRGLIIYFIHLLGITALGFAYMFIFDANCSGFLCGLAGFFHALFFWCAWGVGLFAYSLVQYSLHKRSKTL